MVEFEAEASGEAAARMVAMLTNQHWPKRWLEASEDPAPFRRLILMGY